MFVDEMRRAIAAAPCERLADLSGAVWKAYAGGSISENDAQALAEAVEAKKVVAGTTPAPRRVGSRPRSSESMVRRRRWAACGMMPPQVASHFTLAETAVLAVVAAEGAKGRGCRLTIGHIAALAGCGKTTVRSAIRQAQALGLLVSEEWRLSCWRSAPNHVRIISSEWLLWLRLAARRSSWRGGSSFLKPTITPLERGRSLKTLRKSGGNETARIGPCAPDTHQIAAGGSAFSP